MLFPVLEKQEMRLKLSMPLQKPVKQSTARQSRYLSPSRKHMLRRCSGNLACDTPGNWIVETRGGITGASSTASMPTWSASTNIITRNQFAQVPRCRSCSATTMVKANLE